MTKQRRFPYLATSVVLLLALTGCAGSGGDVAGAAGSTTEAVEGVGTGQFGGQQLALGDPVEGGEFTWGVWMPIQSLDPAGTMGDSILLAMSSLYGTLTKALPDGSAAPNLADSFKTGRSNWIRN